VGNAFTTAEEAYTPEAEYVGPSFFSLGYLQVLTASAGEKEICNTELSDGTVCFCQLFLGKLGEDTDGQGFLLYWGGVSVSERSE
jgi:hypothetical protein